MSERDVAAAVGSTAYGTNGEKIGKVESFFADDRTGVPTWVAVSTGLFGLFAVTKVLAELAAVVFEAPRKRSIAAAIAAASAAFWVWR